MNVDNSVQDFKIREQMKRLGYKPKYITLAEVHRVNDEKYRALGLEPCYDATLRATSIYIT